MQNFVYRQLSKDINSQTRKEVRFIDVKIPERDWNELSSRLEEAFRDFMHISWELFNVSDDNTIVVIAWTDVLFYKFEIVAYNQEKIELTCYDHIIDFGTSETFLEDFIDIVKSIGLAVK